MEVVILIVKILAAIFAVLIMVMYAIAFVTEVGFEREIKMPWFGGKYIGIGFAHYENRIVRIYGFWEYRPGNNCDTIENSVEEKEKNSNRL